MSSCKYYNASMTWLVSNAQNSHIQGKWKAKTRKHSCPIPKILVVKPIEFNEVKYNQLINNIFSYNMIQLQS